MKRWHSRLFPLLVAFAAVSLSYSSVLACIWDADTLFQERLRSPTLAAVILGNGPAAPDAKPLRQRIESLHASPRKDDSAWWNDLAGAHIRLGELQEAINLLEPLLTKFPNDYGIHANLGTAYHLLGRYQEAEREIARDLEINPEAHFGLEKYHLALLQYLIRDPAYQKEHVYVDEWSKDLLDKFSPQFLGRNKSRPDSSSTKTSDYTSPDYRSKWDLAADPNFEKGIVYMASLNPREPACFVMLGIVSARGHDYNLTASAFEKAIALGSPQSEILKEKVAALREWIRKSHVHNFKQFVIPAVIGLFAIWFLVRKFRNQRREDRTSMPKFW